MKKFVRSLILRIVDLFASDIMDCVTGEKLGRGLLFARGGTIRVIGYLGRPLIPRLLPQKHLTYWKQEIGFTAHPLPDFPKMMETGSTARGGSARVLNFMLTHQGGEAFERVRERWKPVCPGENLWVVFGGTREAFEALDYPLKVFVDDPRLRTRDHQREKQCYEGLIKAMAPIIEREAPDYLHLCEYDHIPLVPDLNERQVRVMRAEGADVMVHYLKRIDGTSHPFELYHESDPVFFPYWRSVSRRDDPGVILWMFGSGSFWTREAFLAVAGHDQTIECLFEIYLPTLAHHLGFRVRQWSQDQHLISNLPTPKVTLQKTAEGSFWTAHPIKELPECG